MPRDSPDLHGTTVLVLEGHTLARRVIRRALEGAGARVIEAADVREGLRTIGSRSYPAVDLVLTDLDFTGVSAQELVATLKDTVPDLPVVAIATPGSVPDVIRNVPVIPKPFTIPSLLRSIHVVVLASRAQRRLARQQRADAAQARMIAATRRARAEAQRDRAAARLERLVQLQRRAVSPERDAGSVPPDTQRAESRRDPPDRC